MARGRVHAARASLEGDVLAQNDGRHTVVEGVLGLETLELLDDRDERPGVLLADSELIGIPHRVVIGDRGLKEGKVEYQGRRETEATSVEVAEIAAFVRSKLVV